MANLSWDSPVSAVATSKTKNTMDAKALTNAGVATVGDLLGLFPRRYVRKGSLSELDELTEGDLLSLVGEVVSSSPFTYQDKRTRRTAYRLEVRVRAEGDQTLLLTYFDRLQKTATWRATKAMTRGRVGLFVGRLKWFRNEWQLTNPESRMYDVDETTSTMPELIPIYPAVAGVDPWHLEAAIGLALEVVEDAPEVLPAAVREAEDLLPVLDALRWIHRPDSWAQKVAAEKRLKYDEAFVAQTVLARRRAAIERTVANPRPGAAGGILDRFDGRLPFELTAGQRTVGEEIAEELGHGHPMHRLLQGEVGSGKTVVALRAMLQVVDSGGQAALLAPTEVLAQQHHRSITAMLGDLAQGGFLGGDADGTQVALLTGSLSASARREALAVAAGGEAGIVVGTHALLEEKVQFADLGLVVVDEQHRFGVEQRAALGGKAGAPPHVLVMTATPIPRTVAMTVFGDLDTSTLSELPAGRGDVQTTVVPTAAQPGWLERAWQRVREEVAAGRQAYVVAARIDPGDGEEDTPLHAVEELAPELAEGALAGLRVEMLHGRMTPEAKDRAMQAFAAGEVDVLVSTTVIEVGVDVPNATVMVILDADRFGVSQLHQLRGRIGRGGHAGLCLLVSNAEPRSSSMERLEAVASTRDGFELSRIDLEQRREGNVLGTQQSGGRGGGLKLLSVLRDEDVIERARASATEHLRGDPELAGSPDLARAVAALEDSDQAEYLELS
jgi:ATP-dependent DNA helicase RecG